MLSLHHVRVTLGNRQMLHPVDLDFERGKLYGVLGHNGSGKSTLLKVLARQLIPSGGKYLVDHIEAQRYSPRRYAKHVAYLPQYLPAINSLAGRALIALGRYPWKGPWGRNHKSDDDAVARAIQLTGVEELIDRPVDELSGGERQRVWLAMLLAQESGFLLLDEPLAALDLSHQVEVMGLIRKLTADAGTGVVLSIHDINIAAHYCDELIVLASGRVVFQGAPADIMNPTTLREIFGVPLHIVPHPEQARMVAVV